MAPSPRSKPKLAIYGAAGCGGCEVSLLNLGEKIMMLEKIFQIVFAPCLADYKRADLDALEDGEIDLCLFNGAIRNSGDVEMAKLLRRKASLLVAYGSCAHEGCVPALANLADARAAWDAIYLKNPSTDNPEGAIPRAGTRVSEGELTLPGFEESVRALDQVVAVDYVVPGCAPEAHRVWEALQYFVGAFASGADLPEPGSILGARSMAVCEECPLTRNERKIEKFVRPHEIVPDRETCLLEQGLVCMGVATRAGCGALCPQVGMGCRGCYGPPDGVEDQGARAVAAFATVVQAGAETESEAELRARIDECMGGLVDPAGTFYRFSMAHSLLHRARRLREHGGSKS